MGWMVGLRMWWRSVERGWELHLEWWDGLRESYCNMQVYDLRTCLRWVAHFHGQDPHNNSGQFSKVAHIVIRTSIVEEASWGVLPAIVFTGHILSTLERYLHGGPRRKLWNSWYPWFSFTIHLSDWNEIELHCAQRWTTECNPISGMSTIGWDFNAWFHLPIEGEIKVPMTWLTNTNKTDWSAIILCNFYEILLCLNCL